MLLPAAAICAALIGCARQEPGETEAPDRDAAVSFAAVDTERIRQSGRGAEWLSYGGDYDEQRHSRLDSIKRENVDSLGVAWTFDLKTNRGVESTPLVVDGVMYTTSAWSVVYALDARTGKELWTYDPQVDRRVGVKACCDVVNRGVAVYEGQVFVGVLDGRLEALDARTGERNWSVVTVDQDRPYTITGAPRVVNGKVLIGNGGAELGVRGYLSAYDAASGELVWRFYTVPNPAKKPDNAASDQAFASLANASWGDDGEWVTDGGGGTVWDSIVYDAVTDTVIFGVGNGSPWNRDFRDPAGGDNLFLSSIVAVDAVTGAYRWHFQTTPGDHWDYTATQSIILANLPGPGGTDRRVVMQAPKNGFFYVLDAATGEFISGTPFVPVDWATGLDAKGRPIEAEGARYGVEPITLLPGPLGGHNWHPMAFNPELDLAYIPAQEVPFDFAKDTRHNTRPVTWNTGADFTAEVPDIVSRADLRALRASRKGRLIAWDPLAGEPRWVVEHDNAWNGGALSTAGGLVFQGKLGGDFVAYDAATGDTLWSYDLRSGAASGPMTYEIDGEQYLAITTGWGSAYALHAGYAYDESVPPSVGKVVTFKLGGSGSIPAPMMAAIERTPKAAPFGTDEQITLGKVHYQRICALCHGPVAVSSGVLPDLRWSGMAASAEAWRKVVLEGVLAENGMISFADYLSAEDAENVRAYVLAQAHEAAAAAAAPFDKADVSITSLKQGWLDTGLWLRPGDEVTLAGTGGADFGFAHPLEPRHVLWARVGEEGTIFQLPSNVHSFTAGDRGELYVTASPPALLWANRRGDRVDAFAAMPDVPLSISVTAYAWRDSAREGLEAMLDDVDRGMFARQALAAIDQGKKLPAGFEYLWYLNASNVFGAFDADGRRGVHVSTSDDFGIIRKPLDIPLTPETRIDFDWLYEKLPALGPETDAATHDYMSIALEFDNGQDITWFWSAHLPEGEIFACPLPDWHERETHIVLQSGKDRLGEWHSHSRPVLADYDAAVGGEPPKRIVGAWVIATAVFGRQPAEAYFANARISDGERSHAVFD
jgi:quinohemoprotein ethanol dehydrogenase